VTRIPILRSAKTNTSGAGRALSALIVSTAILGACNGAPTGKTAPPPAAAAPVSPRWQDRRPHLLESDDPRRPRTEAESLRVRDLPIFTEHSLPIEPTTGQPAAGPLAQDVEVTDYQPMFGPSPSSRTVSVKLKAPGFGQFRGFDARYTYYDCNSTLEPPRFQLRWETLITQPASAVEFAVTDGWLEKSSCAVHMHRRSAVRPIQAARGLLLVFRVCREGTAKADPRPASNACDEQNMITFLAPAINGLARDGIGGEVKSEIYDFTRISVSVRRGQAVSLLASILYDEAVAWLGEERMKDLPHDPIVVGIDVAQVVSEAEPTVLAYLQ
jgi:hypothetical protein